MKKYAILGYNTINIGDDIQSFITSTLLNISYIIERDNYNNIYDFNTGILIENLNENVYLIMNGWFMHNSNWKTGNNNIKFPIKNNKIIPIYISTCLSKDVPLLYTNECIEHYKKHAPILCRDKTTFSLLTKKNVEVEFYGCLTQLLDIKNIPDNDNYKKKYENSIIYIDSPREWQNRDKNEKNFYFEHYINNLLTLKPKDRINFAQDLLSKYKYAKKIYSSRLHAYLPCRAMNLNVNYVGSLNYRVIDLVNNIPDKSKLNKKFFDYIEQKSMF